MKQSVLVLYIILARAEIVPELPTTIVDPPGLTYLGRIPITYAEWAATGQVEREAMLNAFLNGASAQPGQTVVTSDNIGITWKEVTWWGWWSSGNLEFAPVPPPELPQEDPVMGLFNVTNAVTLGLERALVYAEDHIPGGNTGNFRYALGFIQKDSGIGAITEAGSFKNGGGLAQNGSVSFVLQNTRGLRDYISAMGADLAGRNIYVVEYEWEESNPAPHVEAIPHFAGIIDAVTWDETKVSFSAKPEFEVSRRSNLQIDGLPVTFGDHDWGYNARVGETEVVTGKDMYPMMFTPGMPGIAPFEKDITIVGMHQRDMPGGRFWELRASYSLPHWFGPPPATAQDIWNEWINNGWVSSDGFIDFEKIFRDKYGVDFDTKNLFLSADGNNESVAVKGFGRYNYVSTYPTPPPQHLQLTIILKKPLPQGHTPEYVNLVFPKAYFMSDKWPNIYDITGPHPLSLPYKNSAFVNRDGEREAMNLYGEIENFDYRYFAVENTPYAYSLRREAVLKEYDSAVFKSINYRPAKRVNMLIDAPMGTSGLNVNRRNLRAWGFPEGEDFTAEYWSMAGGVYVKSRVSVLAQEISATEPDSGTITDGNTHTYSDHGTKVRFSGTHPFPFDHLHCIVIDLPDAPDGVTFDNAYLLLKMFLSCDKAVKFSARLRVGNKVSALGFGWGGFEHTKTWNGGSPAATAFNKAAVINDMPHELFDFPLVGDRGGNIYGQYDMFLVDDLPWDDDIVNKTISRHTNLKLDGIGSNNKLKKQVLLLFEVDSGSVAYQTADLLLRTFYAGVVFEANVSNSDSLLMRTSGRIFNSAWGGRKIPAATISNPIDALEHIRRLSNWSETRSEGASDNIPWGKRYVSRSIDGHAALIDINAFDNPALNDIKQAIGINRQILNENDANTDALAASLCKDFYLVGRRTLPNISWKGVVSPPYESVAKLDAFEVPDDEISVITIKDLVGGPQSIKEPGSTEIFCEPIIKYNYNHGTQRYESELRITNIAAPRWKPEYTYGFNSLANAEYFWYKCKSLFNRYRNFRQMPPDAQERKWTSGVFMAQWALHRLLEWQTMARTMVKVHYVIGKKWGVATHVKLSFPHIKNGAPVLCVCESVKKSKREGVVEANLIILGDTSHVGAMNIIETGSADINIIESGSRDMNIIEGQGAI